MPVQELSTRDRTDTRGQKAIGVVGRQQNEPSPDRQTVSEDVRRDARSGPGASTTAQPSAGAHYRRAAMHRKRALFRAANERMAAWEEQHVQSQTEHYFCECVDPNCREKVVLRKADYEKCRGESGYFVIVPGHEAPEIETVIEQHDGWAIVEKSQGS